MTARRDPADVRRLLQEGDIAGAVRVAERRLAEAPEEAETALLLASAYLETRQPRRAIRILGDLIDTGVAPAEAFNLRGRARNNAGDPPGAEQDFRRAIDQDPDLADAYSNLGHVLRSQRRWSDAAAALGLALDRDPGHIRALTALGTVYLEMDRPDDAAVAFDAVIAAGGGCADLHAFLGVARHRSGDLVAAERAYRAALSERPDHAEAWLNLGISLQDGGRLDEALDAYAHAVASAPRSLAARVRLAEAYLAGGRPQEALDGARALREMDPGHPSALAVEAVALRQLGRSVEALELNDPQRFVRRFDVSAPRGYHTVAEFNTALTNHVLRHPTLAFEPHGHATRGGRHTGNLLDGDKGPVAALERAILDAVATYRAELDLPPDHPFPGPVPETPALSMWAVVMDAEGHQLPHIHPGAWLSGVYYVELPASLGAGPDDRSGWIEFGLPPDELAGECRHPVRDYRPAPGRMFLFPSYFYHRTIPFPGDARRISIAFDVLRRG